MSAAQKVSCVAHPKLLGFAALLALALAGPRLLAEPLLRTVALQGEYAPGTANRFGKLSAPVIDAAGRAAFAGELAGTDFDHDQGLWSEYQGRLQLMVREQSALPVAALDSFFTYSNWQVYGDGRLSFATAPTQYVQGGPGNYQTTVKSINYDRLAVNDVGGLAYVSADNQRLVRSVGGAEVTVASVGQTLPGMPDGLTAGEFLTPAFNDAGSMAFVAAASDAQGPAPWSGIWKYGGDALSPVALANQTAPGAPDGRRFTGLGLPSLNGAGDVAFQASVEGAAENGVWRTHNGQLELVAYRHQQPPGIVGDIDFDYFDAPAINDLGDVAFRGQLKGDLPNAELASGIWAQHDGKLRNIVYEGMPVPGAPAGATFFDNEGGLQPQINNAGQVVFHAQFDHGLAGARGIFAYSVLGDYLWSVKSGDEIEVADNDFRTVTGVALATPQRASTPLAGASQDGRPSALNDAGQLAFEAFFADQSHGVFVVQLPAVPNLTQVPEPSAWLLMLFGGLAVLGTARRKRLVRSRGVHA